MSDKKSMEHVEKHRLELLKQWGPRHFTNMLDSMVGMQRKFGKKFINFDKLTLIQKEKWTKEMVVAMIDELSEILGQINFKHWKKRVNVNQMEVKYEIIDLLHFVLELMLIWGMNEKDIFSMYVAKMHENHDRQKRGY